ncbi:MAG: Ig-like domain-containing protein [Treponema berlinense]|uniref:Ig-like domain-containing protein n=1 Tax=Treponema berlinense TaxID=225004 RepID=UPI002A8283B7|nr:Ig-like domain-containing protein [Treponema berlinense]MDY3707335.1 Ig-like domain-containing protein [Treponema berlinense]
MKKMLRIAAALAALLAMTNFIGCKNDDDDDGDETVATVAVEKVEITSTETDVEVGKTITLTAKVSPENATNKTVTWTSSDTAIATVDSTGKVTGVKAGEATITASAGGQTATVKVTVKAAATSGGETGGETGGSTGGETTTPKTATIAYDGSLAENAPAATGEEGVFSDVQDVIATAGVAEGYSLDEGYPKYGSQTYTGDDGTKNGTTSAGMLFVSSLIDGATKVDFAANAVMAYVKYNFTLSAKSDVEAAVKAFNTQSSSLAGKIEILDSNGNLKASKQADAGSKSANDVTADSVELEAGMYTLKFSWVTTKAAQLKKVNCGISSFSIKATTK